MSEYLVALPFAVLIIAFVWFLFYKYASDAWNWRLWQIRIRRD